MHRMRKGIVIEPSDEPRHAQMNRNELASPFRVAINFAGKPRDSGIGMLNIKREAVVNFEDEQRQRKSEQQRLRQRHIDCIGGRGGKHS